MEYIICGSCDYEIRVKSDSPELAKLVELKDRKASDKQYDAGIKEARHLIFNIFGGDNKDIDLDEIRIYGIADENGDIIVEDY